MKGKILRSDLLKFEASTQLLDSPECMAYAFRDMIELTEPDITQKGLSLEKVRKCNLSESEQAEQSVLEELINLSKPITKWFSQPNLDVDENHDQQLQSFFSLTSSLSNKKIAD